MAYKFSIGAQVLSGSVTMKDGLSVSAGSVNFPDKSVPVADLDIAGGTNLGGTGVADTDEFIFHDADANATKVITGANLYGWVFSKVSGDATVASGGALTIAAGAVEHGMLNDNIISGQGEHAHASILDADDLLIHDSANAVVKKVGVDSLRDHYYASISGDATVADGGALTIAAGAVENGMLAGSIANAKLANSTISGVSLGANLNNLSPSATGGLNGSAYNGSAAVSNLQIDLTTLPADAAFAVGADKFLFYDASEDSHHTGSFVELATAMAGDGLAASSGVLAVGVDDSSIELNSDALRVKASGVTNAMLAGSIANAKLSNSSVTITAGDGLKTGGAVSLGGSVTLDIDVSDFAGTGLSGDGSENLNIEAAQTGITSVKNDALVVGRSSGNDHVDFATGGNIKLITDNTTRFSVQDSMIQSSVPFDSGGDIQVPAGGAFDVAAAGNLDVGSTVGANTLTLGASTSTVVVAGNLTVQGTTTTVDSTTINISSSFTFEGPADAHETTLSCGTPTADITVLLPQYDTAETVHMAVLADATTAASADVTAAEFAMLDASAATKNTGITVHDTDDSFLMNDNGTLKHIRADNLKTYFQTGVTADTAASLRLTGAGSIVNSNITISDDVILVDSSAARTLTMPNIATADIGQVYIIKDAAGNAANQNITINKSTGDHDIDGADSIKIESNHGAVSLLACSGSGTGFFYSIF
tara:strand:- start:988 stop:3111 length:2124 start_codon:yes stop_codon:yes gene_type:complete